MLKNNTLAIALAALLVGGVAVAAFQNNRAGSPFDVEGGLEYAQVVEVDPVTENREQFATVIAADPVHETVTTSTPRQVCNDRVVQQRLPERDGLMGGTIAGAVVGGALGNQVGDGSGQKLATVAGAVAGGYVGRKVDRRHVGGRVVASTQTECHTVSDSSQSSRVVAYNVTYRNEDGTTGNMRTGSEPGERISLGEGEVVVGYDVTYEYDGVERTVRLDEAPKDNRVPLLDGEVVTQTAAVASTDERG